MHGVTALSDAVSVRYAREQYAIGYLHGRYGDDARPDALEFARFYVARCEQRGRLVDVAEAYQRWQAPVPAQLALFG